MGKRYSFALVASQFNAEYVQGLVDNATRRLYELLPGSQVDLYSVPGAFEIPMIAQAVAESHKPDAILALGVIIRGETDHADLIARTVTDSLHRICLTSHIPVLHAVLSARTAEQAHERCLGFEKNRGIEAADAAYQMVHLMSTIRAGRAKVR